MVLVLCINVIIINLPNTEKSNLSIIYILFLFYFWGGGGGGGWTFLESPDNYSGPEGCFMYAVYAVKIKVSIILKIIQWN